jgi:hypothetical protein
VGLFVLDKKEMTLERSNIYRKKETVGVRPQRGRMNCNNKFGSINIKIRWIFQ